MGKKKVARKRPVKSFTLSESTLQKLEQFAARNGMNLSRAVEYLISLGFQRFEELEKRRSRKVEREDVEDLERRYWKRVFEDDSLWEPV